MAIIQGSFVRRVPPSKTKSTAALVGSVLYTFSLCTAHVFSRTKYIKQFFLFPLQGLFLIIPSFACVGFATSYILLYIGLFLFAVCKFGIFFFGIF